MTESVHEATQTAMSALHIARRRGRLSSALLGAGMAALLVLGGYGLDANAALRAKSNEQTQVEQQLQHDVAHLSSVDEQLSAALSAALTAARTSSVQAGFEHDVVALCMAVHARCVLP